MGHRNLLNDLESNLLLLVVLIFRVKAQPPSRGQEEKEQRELCHSAARPGGQRDAPDAQDGEDGLRLTDVSGIRRNGVEVMRWPAHLPGTSHQGLTIKLPVCFTS